MMQFIDGLGSSQETESKNTVTFQGVKFNLGVRVTDEAFCANAAFSMKRLVEFLTEVENLSQKSDKELGLVVYADDQFINQKQMALQMKDIGLDNRLKMFANGQTVVDFVSELLTQLKTEADWGVEQVSQPISLLLLDINMPVLNGYETLTKVKELYSKVNEIDPSHKFLRPLICYLSQTDQAIMN